MGVKMDKSPKEMSLQELSEYSARELACYRRREPSNDKYCLEIFHRAVLERSSDAWAILQMQFNDNMRMWIGRHPHKESALRHEDEQSYINDAFSRFWRAVSEQRLTFSTLAAALNYLHICLNSAIMDTLRAYSKPREEPIPDYGHPDEPPVEDLYLEDELWEVIQAILPGEKERRMAYLHFHCNLKPREIIRYCPCEFKSEDEIYRLKRNVVERILRNADKIRWKLGQE
jgi:hypothetical protein